jgi:TolA-binding protein
MNHPRCSRAWQAEAVFDKRLSAADRAAFEAHAQGCADCARERAALVRLKELGQRSMDGEATPLARKRQRNELLRRAHASSVSVPRVPWWSSGQRWVWPGLASAAVLVAALLWLRSGSPSALGAPKYETRAAPNTLWRAPEEGPRARLSLSDGSLQVAVQKLEAGQSFVITLPDGELEVRGTRFVVDVKAPRTERVAVTEGLVALRLRGQHELLLRAGDTWTAPVEARPEVTTPPSAVASPPPVVSSASPAAPPVPAHPASAALLRASSAAGAAEPPAAPTSPAGQFGEAMAAYARGDFASAEQLFQRFEAKNPYSSQLEDSLFLRALSRQRRGDTEGARRLASEYVHRYPTGFRTAEAKRLLEAR